MSDETRSLPDVSALTKVGITHLIGAASGVLDAMIAALEAASTVGVGAQQAAVNVEGKTLQATIDEMKALKTQIVASATQTADAVADAIPG